MVMKTINISVGLSRSYTGSHYPTNYKFLCFVGDKDEKQKLLECAKNGLDIIQIEIPFEE